MFIKIFYVRLYEFEEKNFHLKKNIELIKKIVNAF